MFDWLFSLIEAGRFIISPFLLFACFYFIGGNIDLASDFLSVLLSLFIGSWTGQLIGGLLIFCYISQALFGSAPYTMWQYLWAVFHSAFSLEFFVGFTALAMAYIMRKC
jgi:hypothetical protein